MKPFTLYLTTFLMLLSGVSCSDWSDSGETSAARSNDLQIIARSKGFDEQTVSTKSLKTADESTVTNMALFVFDSNDAIVDYQFVEGSKPLFTIDRDNPPYSNHTQSLLQNAKIYILANVITDGDFATVFGASTTSISNLGQLLALNCPVTGIDRPQIGFPMFGQRENLDLRLKANSTLAPGAVIDITLNCLFSKIVFNISVTPDQTSENIQKFTLDTWTVHNIPAAVQLLEPDNNAETAHYNNILASTFTRSTYTGANPTQQNGTQLSFSFYMPEHKVNPATNAANFSGYPWGHDSQFDSNRQQYKPLLLGTAKENYATYVEIKGHYIDHNTKEREVTYRVYLGEDNYENFYIRRDKQLNNNITITGITNSSLPEQEGTVSFDHRVDVQQSNYRFLLERETLLDSHWEIRPIRIVLDHNLHPDAKIQIEILNPSTANWLRMEMPSNPGGSEYCAVNSTDLAYGKRKYFTTDLVTSTLSGGTLMEIEADPNKAEHVIWMYIDENTTLPSTDGSTTRNATVQCRYYDDGNTVAPPDVSEDYVFMQRSLHRITENGHTYYIEYFEEYLYNFDSKESYGTTTDGMAWGLNNIQLSSQYNAISMGTPTLEKNGMASLITAIISTIETNINNAINTAVGNIASNYGAKYDFYLTRDGISNVTVRDYQGLNFTKEIYSEAGIGPLATNETPRSAIEYCVNKNKRNADGTISTSGIHWFMPAIDQIEEITMGGYSDFEVFQNKYYWSSQPAYKGFSVNYSVTCYNSNLKWAQVDGTATGNYFKDNKTHARATKVNHNGSSYQNVESGTTGNYGSLTISHEGVYTSLPSPTYTPSAESGDDAYCQEGNMARNTVNRIRCAYQP